MVDITVVSRVAQNAYQKPFPSSRKSQLFSGTSRKSSHFDPTKLQKTSGLDHLRDRL